MIKTLLYHKTADLTKRKRVLRFVKKSGADRFEQLSTSPLVAYFFIDGSRICNERCRGTCSGSHIGICTYFQYRIYEKPQYPSATLSMRCLSTCAPVQTALPFPFCSHLLSGIVVSGSQTNHWSGQPPPQSLNCEHFMQSSDGYAVSIL